MPLRHQRDNFWYLFVGFFLDLNSMCPSFLPNYCKDKNKGFLHILGYANMWVYFLIPPNLLAPFHWYCSSIDPESVIETDYDVARNLILLSLSVSFSRIDFIDFLYPHRFLNYQHLRLLSIETTHNHIQRE